jgi:hypothetical protein
MKDRPAPSSSPNKRNGDAGATDAPASCSCLT